MTDLIVSDSTCLIGLERIGKLNLLPEIFSRIIIPPAVQQEFGISLPWLTVQIPTNQGMIVSLKMLVDDGEAEAIALAYELNSRLIVDDLQARNAAQGLGISIIGTVGILVKAKHQGLIDKLSPILENLEKNGFYLSRRLKSKALELVEE